MPRTVRYFLLGEAATFVIAAAIHAGLLITGYEHREARIAESLIALVLLVGLTIAWVRPPWTRAVGLFAQGFALFWTLVGIATIIVGIGPRTVPDASYHAAIVAVLVWGLVVAWRTRVPAT